MLINKRLKKLLSLVTVITVVSVILILLFQGSSYPDRSVNEFADISQTRLLPRVTKTPTTIPTPIETIVLAESIIGKNVDEIENLLGMATYKDENTPPISSHYEWDMRKHMVYAESLKPYSQEPICYLEITIKGVCINSSKALALFGMDSGSVGYPARDVAGVMTWEPYGDYDRVRLWCDQGDQHMKIIPDATAGL